MTETTEKIPRARQRRAAKRAWLKHRVDVALERIVANVLLRLGLYEREHPLPPEGPGDEDKTVDKKGEIGETQKTTTSNIGFTGKSTKQR